MSRTIPLDGALGRNYRFAVIADPEGGYVIRFPDLTGCLTQIETIPDVDAAADEIRTLGIETAYQLGQTVPE